MGLFVYHFEGLHLSQFGNQLL